MLCKDGTDTVNRMYKKLNATCTNCSVEQRNKRNTHKKKLRDCDFIHDGSSESGKWWYGLDRAGSGQGQVAGTCECGNEPSGSIKMRGIS